MTDAGKQAAVDLSSAELEMTSSIYEGFSTAIMVAGEPRTVALTREYSDAVQLMAIIDRDRRTLPLVIRLYAEGVLSEGQAQAATGLDRVEVRRLADEQAASGNDKLAGYEGVKDAEVNKSLPTQGGGAGDRETVARIIDPFIFMDEALVSDEVDLENAEGRRIAHEKADKILAALQAAPSEGGEPVAWRVRIDPAVFGFPIFVTTRDTVEHWAANGYQSDALYARPPAPSEEPLVGWKLVPVDADAKMLKAMDTNNAGYGMGLGANFLRDVWANALAAAPAPDAIRGGEK